MNDLELYTEKTFEDIKHIDEYGNEYWYARELQIVLEYTEWRKFSGVIEKAKEHVTIAISRYLNVLSAPTKHQKCLMEG